jgi:hypothetical protein
MTLVLNHVQGDAIAFVFVFEECANERRRYVPYTCDSLRVVAGWGGRQPWKPPALYHHHDTASCTSKILGDKN